MTQTVLKTLARSFLSMALDDADRTEWHKPS